MAFVKAGRYDEVLLQPRGQGGAVKAVTDADVYVYESDGSTLATLYTGRDKTAGANPVSPDASGNLEFFADPGTYVLKIFVDGALLRTDTVSVPYDPSEIDADAVPDGGTENQILSRTAGGSADWQDADAIDVVDKSSTQTVTGEKNFTGGIKENGTELSGTYASQKGPPRFWTGFYGTDPANTAAQNTTAIQATIDAAEAAGGGEVLVALTGTVDLVASANALEGTKQKCLVIDSPDVTLVIPRGTTLRLADGQQTDAAGPVEILVVAAQDVTVTGGGAIEGNTAGQTGWTGGYAQRANGNIIRPYGDVAGLTVSNLRLSDHFSNPISMGNNGVGYLDGCTFRDLFATACGEGYEFSRLRHSLVDNVDYLATAVNVGDAVEFSDCDFTVCTNSKAREGQSGGGSGFDLYGCTNFVLANFRADRWQNGITVHPSTGAGNIDPKNIIIDGGEVYGSQTNGVQFTGDVLDNIKISDTIIDGNNVGAAAVGVNLSTGSVTTGPVTIANCTIRNWLANGIRYGTIKRVKVTDTIIAACGTGVLWNGAGSSTAQSDVDDIDLLGVSFLDNTTGLSFQSAGTAGLREPSGQVAGCTFRGNTTDLTIPVNTGLAKRMRFHDNGLSTSGGLGGTPVGGYDYITATDAKFSARSTLKDPTARQRLWIVFDNGGNGGVTLRDESDGSGDNLNFVGAANFVSVTSTPFDSRLLMEYDEVTDRWFEVTRRNYSA